MVGKALVAGDMAVGGVEYGDMVVAWEEDGEEVAGVEVVVAWDVALEPPENELLLPDDRYGFGTRLVALFGGGARWFLTDRILIRGDIVVNMYQLKTPRGYLDTSREFTGVGEKEWVSGPILSIGTAWHF